MVKKIRSRLTSVRGKTLVGFAIIIVFVLIMVLGGVYQLAQVRAASTEVVPGTEQINYVQEFALSMSSLESNLDRFFVTGGVDFGENIQAELRRLDDILSGLQSQPNESTAETLNKLDQATETLHVNMQLFLEADHDDLSPNELNRTLIELYQQIDAVNVLQQQLSQETLTYLKSVASLQQVIIDNVNTQVLLFSVIVFLVAVGAAVLVTRTLRPIGTLTEVSLDIASGNLEREAPVESHDEIGTLAQAFNSMTRQLRDLVDNLENRVAERTKDLELASEISQSVSQIRDLHELTTTAVSLIRQRFDLYHVQLYLADDTQTILTLLASTGEAGAQMLAAGHTLPIDDASINGRAAVQKQPILVADTAASPNFMPHPLLPDTRSETAVPLIVGSTVVGILDLQSDQPHTITEENLPAFVTLAGQLAIAILNASQNEEIRKSQEAMQTNEALLRTIIDSTPDWIFVKDLDHRYMMVNQGYAESFNITPADFIGKNDLDIGFPEEIVKGDPEKGIRGFWADDREIMERGEVKIIDVEPAILAGEQRFLNTIKAPLKDASGNVTGVVGFVHDITDRIRIEEDVRERETLLRTIIDSTPDWIFVKDLDHRYVMVNQGYADSFHMTTDGFIGKNDLDIGFPEEIVKGDPDKGIRGFWADDREIMERGQIKIIDEEPAVIDGEPRTLNTIKVPLKNQAGEVIGIVGFVHDITNLKQAEAVMSKQASELQTVAELSTAVSTTLDTKQLLQEVVDRTKESFNLYHAHIYLLDASQNYLQLAAGAGEVGKQMVAAGHNIPFHHQYSLVAQAARSGQGVIVNQVTADPAFLPNPLLPDTQSEMAVPMMVGNKVIGVLDLQSDSIAHFTSTDINIQTTLATQIATALENVRAYEQARRSAIIIENTTNIIATMSIDQEIQYLNKAGLQQLGYKSLADVQGKNISILFPPEGAEEHRAPAIMGLQEQGFWRGESMLITTSGKRFPVDQVVSMIRDDDGVPQMIVFNMTDITEQKQAEEAQKALTSELEEQLERVNALQRSVTREGWQAFMTASKRPFQGFEFSESSIKTLTLEDLSGENGHGKRPLHTGGNEFINPVRVHGATIGQIGARNPDGKPLSEAQQELLASLTNQVAEALERARLSEQTQIALTETEQREQELAILNEMAQSLTAQTTVDSVLEVIHEYTARLMESDEFYIAFFDAATNEIIFPYGVTEGRTIRNYGRRKAGKGLTEHVLEQGHPVLIPNNIDQYLHNLGIEAVGKSAESWMGCPLQYGEQIIGLISLQSYTKANAYDEPDLRLLTAIANQAAIAIENARLIEATGKRARQEQLLREVSTKVSAAVDAESVLQVATREIGRALGLETFVYLKNPKKNQ